MTSEKKGRKLNNVISYLLSYIPYSLSFSHTQSAEQTLLQALITGYTLKSQRDLEGNKQYNLHALDGTIENVDAKLVKSLSKRSLIVSNQKFPVATYVLTNKGKQQASTLTEEAWHPVSAKIAQ